MGEAVIIPHYNDVARLQRCLAALMPQIDDAIDVVVADNGSDQSLEPIRANWPNVRIVNQPKKGAGPARNAGVAASASKWIYFLDADCVPAADWVEVARSLASEGTVWGGYVELFDETPAPRSGAEAFETVFAFQIDWYLKEKRFLPSCQLVLPRTVFDTVGPFRGDISEDVDWCHRVLDAGFDLRASDGLIVAHPTRSDWKALTKKWRRITTEGFLEFGQGARGRIYWAMRALAMPLSAFAHSPRVFTNKKLLLRDRIAALGTLFRIRLARMAWMFRQIFTGQA